MKFTQSYTSLQDFSKRITLYTLSTGCSLVIERITLVHYQQQ